MNTHSSTVMRDEMCFGYNACVDSFFAQTSKFFPVPLSAQQKAVFRRYESELVEWNERFNLTAIRDVEGIRAKHFLDSLSCLSVMGMLHNERIIDVGTGAGFPGIPLKIACPGIHLTLVESVGKKAGFCKHIVDTLKLDHVDVLTLRAEEVGRLPNHRAQYDWAVARAVAALPILTEYLLPLLKLNGKMLAQKGESAHAEVQASANAFRLLGAELQTIEPVTLPGVADERFLVVIKKIAATHTQYPRSVGIPSKKPL